nr:hypothetical protein [Deltaproteobacteria bacterium]
WGMFTRSNLEENETWSRLIAGFSYKPHAKIAVALNYQMQMNKKHKGEDEDYSGIFLNTMFKF